MIEFTNLGASGTPDFVAGAGSSYLSPSWTPPTTGLILLFVEHGEPDAFNDPPTVTGNGLTWVRVGTATYEFDEFVGFDLSRISLYAAAGAGGATGQATIAFADPQSRCEASFFHATGADLSGGVAAAFRTPIRSQVGNASSGTISLLSPLNANNRPISAFAHRVNESSSPRTNWTEMDDLTNSTAIGLETQVRQDAFETTASASWASTAEWGGISVELKAGAGATPNIAAIMHHLRQQGIS